MGIIKTIPEVPPENHYHEFFEKIYFNEEDIIWMISLSEVLSNLKQGMSVLVEYSGATPMLAVLRSIIEHYSDKNISIIFSSEVPVKIARNFIEKFETVPEILQKVTYYIPGGKLPFENVEYSKGSIKEVILKAKNEIMFLFGLNYLLAFDEAETAKQLLTAISKLEESVFFNFIPSYALCSKIGQLIRFSHDVVMRISAQLDGYILEITNSWVPGIPPVSIDFPGRHVLDEGRRVKTSALRLSRFLL